MKAATKQKVGRSRQFKFAYMQEFGSFPYSILVSVGQSAEELEATARKLIKKKKHIQKVWDSFHVENMDEYMACRGWTDWFEGGQSILWLRKWGTKEFAKTLNHEVVHVIDYFYKHTVMDGMETRAYLQEYLCDSITNQLNKKFSVFNKKIK